MSTHKAKIKVKVNSNDAHRFPLGRQEVDAIVMRETPTAIWVKLPDGNIVKRKKNRDLVDPPLSTDNIQGIIDQNNE